MSHREMPAEHAILGLLARAADDGAGYGYDLARSFSDGQPLAEILRLEPGMLYHHLKKLDRAGWIEAEPEAESSGSRPPRRLYRLTGAGRAQLDRWLGEPVTHTREIRLEFLVKLYFVRLLQPDRVSALIAEQRETLRRIAATMAAQQTALDSAAPEGAASDRAFTHLVLELRRRQTQAAIAWLDTVLEQAETWERPSS